MTSSTSPGGLAGRIETLLQGVPILSSVPPQQLQGLAARGRTVRFPAGSAVFREGDPAGELFIILEGALRVVRRGNAGQDVALATLSVGDIAGEMALLDGGARSATVAAMTDCELFTLDRDTFFALLSESPALMPLIFSNLTGKIRETTERLFQEELAARMVQAEMEKERLTAVSQLVASVARELTTPIGVVRTAANIIGRSLGSGAIRAAAGNDRAARLVLDDLEGAAALLEANIARAADLVQRFRNLSVATQAGTVETVGLHALINEVLDLYRVTARFTALAVEVRDELPAEARTWTGDRVSLSQALVNLLANAEQHAYVMGGPVTVTLAADGGGPIPSVAIVIADQGAGIAPEHLPRVFDPFFTTARKEGNSGLGLTIVHQLVTQTLHGRVSVASRPGQGTAVTLVIPRSVAE